MAGDFAANDQWDRLWQLPAQLAHIHATVEIDFDNAGFAAFHALQGRVAGGRFGAAAADPAGDDIALLVDKKVLTE